VVAHGSPDEVTADERVVAAYLGCAAASSRFADALELVASRAEGWSDIAPTAWPLDELAAAGLDRLAAGDPPAVKVLVDPWTEQARPAQTRPAPAVPRLRAVVLVSVEGPHGFVNEGDERVRWPQAQPPVPPRSDAFLFPGDWQGLPGS
jgi:hypothetical protein